MTEHDQMSLFQYKMCERFTKGRKKYKYKYLKRDNLSELQDELIDVANYAMMQWLVVENLKEKAPYQTLMLNRNEKRHEKDFVILKLDSGCVECVSHSKNSERPTILIDRKNIKVSRYLWEQKYGKIPKNMCVLHKCDNPKCINIDHLFLGTQLDNIRDRTLKGRTVSINTLKISNKDAIKIFNSKMRTKDLAEKYGISKCHVMELRRGVGRKILRGMIKNA